MCGGRVGESAVPQVVVETPVTGRVDVVDVGMRSAPIVVIPIVGRKRRIKELDRARHDSLPISQRGRGEAMPPLIPSMTPGNMHAQIMVVLVLVVALCSVIVLMFAVILRSVGVLVSVVVLVCVVFCVSWLSLCPCLIWRLLLSLFLLVISLVSVVVLVYVVGPCV